MPKITNAFQGQTQNGKDANNSYGRLLLIVTPDPTKEAGDAGLKKINAGAGGHDYSGTFARPY